MSRSIFINDSLIVEKFDAGHIDIIDVSTGYGCISDSEASADPITETLYINIYPEFLDTVRRDIEIKKIWRDRHHRPEVTIVDINNYYSFTFSTEGQRYVGVVNMDRNFTHFND